MVDSPDVNSEAQGGSSPEGVVGDVLRAFGEIEERMKENLGLDKPLEEVLRGFTGIEPEAVRGYEEVVREGKDKAVADRLLYLAGLNEESYELWKVFEKAIEVGRRKKGSGGNFRFTNMLGEDRSEFEIDFFKGGVFRKQEDKKAGLTVTARVFEDGRSSVVSFEKTKNGESERYEVNGSEDGKVIPLKMVKKGGGVTVEVRYGFANGELVAEEGRVTREARPNRGEREELGRFEVEGDRVVWEGEKSVANIGTSFDNDSGRILIGREEGGRLGEKTIGLSLKTDMGELMNDLWESAEGEVKVRQQLPDETRPLGKEDLGKLDLAGTKFGE